MRVGLTVVLSGLIAASGCALLAGLDQYDTTSTGGGGSASNSAGTGGNSCQRSEDCKTTTCNEPVCNGGMCTTVPLATGAPCDAGGVYCDSMGACTGCLSDKDCGGAVCKSGHCIDKLLWAKRYGDSTNQQIRAVGFQPSGDLVVAGFYQGTIDLGDGASPASSTAGEPFFGILAGATGKATHSLYPTPTASTGGQVEAIAIDSAGDVFATGSYVKSLALGTLTLSQGTHDDANDDAFVVRLAAADLTPGWSQGFGLKGFQSGQAIALTDPTAGEPSVWFGGTFTGMLSVGTTALQGPMDAFFDVFVGGLSSVDGTAPTNLALQYGGTSYQRLYSMASDAKGNVFLGGSFNNQIVFGGTPGTVTSLGKDDGYVAEIKAGVLEGATVFATQGEDVVGSVAPTPTGIVVAGIFQNAMELSTGTLTSQGGSDAFVASMTSAGKLTWAKSFGSPDNQGETHAVADSKGNIYLVTLSPGPVDFGGGPVGPPKVSTKIHMLFAKFDPTGKHLFSTDLASSQSFGGVRIAVSGEHTFAISGWVTGDLTVDEQDFPAADGAVDDDAFAAVYFVP